MRMMLCAVLALVVGCGGLDPDPGGEEEMPQQVTVKARGLYTYPNPLSEVPDGAFSRADDVVMRRPGFVETRRGFKAAPGTFPWSSNDRVDLLLKYGSTLLASTKLGKIARYDSGAGTWTDYGIDATPPTGERMRFVEAADSLYFTTSGGLYRLDELTGTPVRAGVRQALVGTASTTGSSGFLPINSGVAYRLVWGYRNPNDRLILGAPSSRFTVTNPSGAANTVNVSLTIPVPSWVTTDYFLQVYRSDVTAQAALVPSDDMALVYERYPTASEVSAASLTFTDITPDALKGAALYSSPNIGETGPGSEKFEPPVSADLAYFRERLWAAKTSQRHNIALTLLSVDATSNGMQDGQALTLSITGLTETYTAGTAENISTKTFRRHTSGTAAQNVENTTRSLVRIINAASSYWQAHYVSGEYDSPGQVLIETQYLDGRQFYPQTKGDGRYWAPALRGSFTATGLSRSGSTVTVTTGSVPHGLSVAQQVTMSASTNTSAFPNGVKTVASIVSSTSFTYTEAGAATSTSSAVFTIDAPLIYSENNAQPHGLAYSEYGEPDAFPLANYFPVGASNFPVRRILPLGDSLFVFKDDGVWTVYGDGPEAFTPRPFPVALKIKAPESAVVLGSRIYALTDQGVVALSESGFEVVSGPIEGTILGLVSGSEALATATESYAFGVSYESEREYHLFVPTTSADEYATQAFIFNYASGGWTRWTIDAYAGYVLPGSDLEYLGNPSGAGVLVERKARTTDDYQDADGVAIPAAVDWTVRTGGAPGAQKRWVRMTVLLEQPNAPSSVTLGTNTEINSSRTSGPFTVDGMAAVTTYIPEEHSRSQVLICGVSGGQAGKLLAIQGLTVEYSVSGQRLR